MISILLQRCCLHFFIVMFTLMIPLSPGHAEPWSISADEWSRPRAGQSLVTMPALRHAVKGLNAEPMSILLIRYPGGDEGALWANELRDWLVSLGLPSSRIKIYPGQSKGETITLGLKKLKEMKE